MPNEPSRRSSLLRPRLLRRLALWGLGVVLLYGLSGFVLLPALLRHQLPGLLQQTLSRPVSLNDLRINPFALSAELSGLKITEESGAPLLGFDRLYLRFSLLSLPYRAWTFSEIRLEGAQGDIIHHGNGDTNIGRLIAGLSQTAPATPAPQNGDLPRLQVNSLIIADAKLALTDHQPGQTFRTEVGPVNISLSDLSTLPQKTGEQHIQIGLEGGASLDWSSQSSLTPLLSSGHVTAKGPFIPLISRYLGDMLMLSAPSGSLEAALDYRLQARPDGALALTVEHLDLDLANLHLQEPGAPSPFLTLPNLRLSGGTLAWPERTASAERLTVSGLDLSLRRGKDGQIAPMPQTKQATATPATAPPAQKPVEPDWTVSLGKAELKGAKAHFQDQSLRQTARLDLDSLDLTAESLTNRPGAVMPFRLSSALTGGSVGMQGRLSLFPSLALTATLTAADLHLAAAQAYLHEWARLSIEDGKLASQTDITLDQNGLGLSGTGAVEHLRLIDEQEKTPVVAWDRLALEHFDYRLSGNDLQISQVTLNGPYLRFRVAANQSTNFSHILLPANQAQAATANGPPPKIGIGKIAIAQGAADYDDASLPLPFAAHIADLQGALTSLASTAASPTRVALRGQVGEFGQAKIDGHLTPFDPSRNTKIALAFQNVEFPGLSPYTVKFAGRRIAQGKLDVDLRYAIAAGKLNGANRVVIRDIALGEKLDVPGAMSLPLELAIALLKDDDGKIDIELPVSGNLNDPQFDVGSVVSQTVLKLLGNLVTSPFRALASLFGGGDSLDHVGFAPGRADLAPPEREKILHLTKLLQKRPSLGLAVPTVLDPEADAAQLRADAIDAHMDQALGNRNTIKRQRQWLEDLFAQRLGKDALAPLQTSFQQAEGGLDEPGYAAALREALIKTEPLPEPSLPALAQARAAAVLAVLVEIFPQAAERVRQQGSSTAHTGEDGMIPLGLEAVSR